MNLKESLQSIKKADVVREISMAQGKVPPNAVDFEKLVIGILLIDKKGLDESIDLLTPEVFYDPRHQVIFSAVLQLFQSNRPVDMPSVIHELKKEEKLSLAGGDAYIIDLTLGVSSSANVEYYVRVILEKFILRKLIEVSAEVIDKSYKDNTEVFELLDKAEQAFLKLQTEPSKKDLIPQTPLYNRQ